MLIEPKCGGKSCITDDDYVEGSPEFVGEISASSVSIDLHEKFAAYRRNGIQEYFVWRVIDGEIDWFSLRNGEYERLLPDAEGITRARVPRPVAAHGGFAAGRSSPRHAGSGARCRHQRARALRTATFKRRTK